MCRESERARERERGVCAVPVIRKDNNDIINYLTK